MYSTKGQRKKLEDCHLGVGFIVWHSAHGQCSEIEFYTGDDNILRRVANGKPLFPIEVRELGKTTEVTG